MWRTYYENRRRHRDTSIGPALIEYYENGSIHIEIYYENGIHHRHCSFILIINSVTKAQRKRCALI